MGPINLGSVLLEPVFRELCIYRASSATVQKRGVSDASYRLEYSRLPPSSCDGEPVPDLMFPVAVLILLLLCGFPKGDRTAVPAGASIGEVLAVDDPDRG